MSPASPMTILFVTDQLRYGGAERHLLALATGLAARGHRIAVASLKGEAPEADPGEAAELEESLRAGGVAPVVCCQSRGGLDLAALTRLAGLIDMLGPSLLVGTSQYSLMFAALARLRTRSRPALAFICHSMGMVRRDSGARLRFIVYRQFYRSADCVVFVSESQRRYFAALGVSPRRAEVVHNGIDLGAFAADAVAGEAAILRARYGLSRQDLVIGLCAVFREEKRHVDLLAALANLRQRGLQAKVLLVGDGALRPRIEALRDQLGLGEAVLLAGFQADVRPYIAMCDVMALTSHDENFPIATLEYMALGKAVVASEVGALSEQVDSGVTGLLYPAGDIAALAHALRRCGDSALRERLGQAAQAAVGARFGLQRMLARYEAIFRSLQHAAQTA